jgi:hypothetical protein
MARRRNILLIATCAVIAVVAVCFSCLRTQEPSYNGRTLGEWLDTFARISPEREQDEALNAVRAIGTNAIPQLFKWSTADNTVVVNVSKKHPNFPGARKILRSAERSRVRADTGIAIIWRDAFPIVQTLMTNSDPELGAAATNAMNVIRAMKSANEHGIAQ